MRMILAQIGDNKTIDFAVKEIARLIKTMDSLVVLDIRKYKNKDFSVKNALWIGLDESIKTSKEDGIFINVKNGAGIISGTNERSVLMAAYRFMYELGCRFLYPGADGEKIPKRTLDYSLINADVKETPDYNHRGICIEGGVSWEHVYNTIDWLPKVGMSAFFTQFFTPGTFFRMYYEKFYKDPNDRDFGNELSNDDIDAMVASLLDEVYKRGLIYHAVGHGWNCKPFGLDDSGWDIFEGEIDKDVQKLLALRDGKREFCGGKPKNTNLCYSNPYVQNRITDYITEYCANNPKVDYLHFWLADDAMNHCECEECVKKRPSDYYVDMLNLLDEKMTKAGVNTKIVFLIYVDLLFAPIKERIKNPDRFALMFAPINRWYRDSYADIDLENLPELPEYQRNKEFLRCGDAPNVAYLLEWRKIFDGKDAFNFDYHLMWKHHDDPGSVNIARLLHKDMVALCKLGLDGMMSCQLLRSAFPTGLSQYAMAAALWNKSRSFEEVADEYFSAAFEDAPNEVYKYLQEISDLFRLIRSRGQGEEFKKEAILNCNKVKDNIKAFTKEFIDRYKDNAKDWHYLAVHAVLTDILADIYIAAFKGDKEKIDPLKAKFKEYIHQSEDVIDKVCDVNNYCKNVLEMYLNAHLRYI
ncbi:MAG: DUF4838 domain-containing protein [Ruminococcaceae bacterium]|nr:DUF4838 domain-containing protein [Oscillospiraceae bacterium]